MIDLDRVLEWIKINDFTDVYWTDFEGKDHYCNMNSVIQFLKEFSWYLNEHPIHKKYFLPRS